jgi:hypothetical protein
VARLRPGSRSRRRESEVERVAAAFQSEHRDIYSGNLQLEVTLSRWGGDGAPGPALSAPTLGGRRGVRAADRVRETS